jgi:hypothetical protein
MPHKSTMLLRGVDRVHRAWLLRPCRFATVSALLSVALVFSAWGLGVLTEKSPRLGFWDANNWKAILLLTPLAVYLFPLFLGWTSNAVQSLDKALVLSRSQDVALRDQLSVVRHAK